MWIECVATPPKLKGTFRIPYMGSKNKIANAILDVIEFHAGPIAGRPFFDLFCGGGAIAYQAALRGAHVFANDFDRGLIELHKKLQEPGFKVPTEWISREDFHKHKTREDWYGAFVHQVWSFGNGGRGYLYGKHVEHDKRVASEFALSPTWDRFVAFVGAVAAKKYETKHGRDVGCADLSVHGRYQNYHRVRKQLQRLQQLERLQQLQQLERLQQLEQLQQLQRLQQLERLQQLQQLEQLQQLTFSSLDYRHVPIPENAIVYCDPPYRDTASYRGKAFDHDAFWLWVKEIPSASVFVSEYSGPEWARCVLERQKKTSLCSGLRDTKPERLFFHRGTRAEARA